MNNKTRQGRQRQTQKGEQRWYRDNQICTSHQIWQHTHTLELALNWQSTLLRGSVQDHSDQPWNTGHVFEPRGLIPQRIHGISRRKKIPKLSRPMKIECSIRRTCTFLIWQSNQTDRWWCTRLGLKKKKETTLFKVAIWGHPLLQIMHITGGGHNLNDTGNDTNYGRLRGSSTCDKT